MPEVDMSDIELDMPELDGELDMPEVDMPELDGELEMPNL
jgi:hypothetical protein